MKKIDCGLFSIDPDIINEINILDKRLPLYNGEAVELKDEPNNYFKKHFIKKENKKNLKNSAIFNEKKWEYMRIDFLILELKKANVSFYDKLPKYKIEKTKKQIELLEEYNIEVDKINKEISDRIKEFNKFLYYIKNKEELSLKSKIVKEKIEKAREKNKKEMIEIP